MGSINTHRTISQDEIIPIISNIKSFLWPIKATIKSDLYLKRILILLDSMNNMFFADSIVENLFEVNHLDIKKHWY